MNKHKAKLEGLKRRQRRVRGKVSGTSERPRLRVTRTNANIYAQIIDDTTGRTLCAAGLAALCLCLCWELPHAAVLAVGATAEPALLPELFAALALCCVGALGGVCAAACARRPE